MARRYLFSDESGDFVFNRTHGSRYFAVATLLIEETELGHLRRELAKLRDGRRGRAGH